MTTHHELRCGLVEAELTDQNYSVQTGLFDASHKAFRDGVQIWRMRRQANRFDARSRKGLTAVFARHRPLDPLDNGGNRVAIILELLGKLAESAHIPVQSGSDRVLKLMHRGYTRERFLSIIEKLRRVKPAIGISTDFIVGFPGETEADFEETLSLAREAGFAQAFVFKYSQRRDTPAADMPEQVSQAVKEERNQRLLEVVNASGARQHEKLVGRQVEILVERPSKKNPVRMMGRTRCNKIVVFDGSARRCGLLLDVKIQRAGTFTLYGEVDEGR